MTSQNKSVIAFLAAVFCIAVILVALMLFGQLVSLPVALILGIVAYRLVKTGLALWNAYP